jgi:hypothetical protein
MVVAFCRLSGSGYNVLTIEEPWVTQDLTAECRAALTNRYLAARNTQQQLSANTSELAEDCAVGHGPAQSGVSARTPTDA